MIQVDKDLYREHIGRKKDRGREREREERQKDRETDRQRLRETECFFSTYLSFSKFFRNFFLIILLFWGNVYYKFIIFQEI
jgi:hypothetical protein